MQEDGRESSSSDFGTLLRRYRIAAGLSQEELAERARLSFHGISALERGYRRTPQRETLALLVG
ncbi:MAG: helix-turn-helix transcriptional regulator, partial [Candidatus Cybelea sp.]